MATNFGARGVNEVCCGVRSLFVVEAGRAPLYHRLISFCFVAQQRLQLLHLRQPELVEEAYPFLQLGESLLVQYTISLAADVVDRNEPGVLQYFNVFGYCRAAHLKIFGQGVYRQAVFAEQLQYLAAAGVSNGLERVKLLGCHTCVGCDFVISRLPILSQPLFMMR